MLGKTHQLVANLAMAQLDQNFRHILYPRWGGIESGATLSDEFHIQWEPEAADSELKQLVHRYYVDSDNPKDHGCVTRAFDNSDGAVSFIQAYKNGDLEGSYDEDSFLENLGMFMGIACHHITDLCSPVHVGHKIFLEELEFSDYSRFHSKVERDIDIRRNRINLKISSLEEVQLSKDLFITIAEETYENDFKSLDRIYRMKDENEKLIMTSQCISRAVHYTALVWTSILLNGEMDDRKWSMQPLL